VGLNWRCVRRKVLCIEIKMRQRATSKKGEAEELKESGLKVWVERNE